MKELTEENLVHYLLETIREEAEERLYQQHITPYRSDYYAELEKEMFAVLQRMVAGR